jgi:hypothetical protein
MKKELKNGISKTSYLKAKERANRFYNFLKKNEALKVQEFMTAVQGYGEEGIERNMIA